LASQSLLIPKGTPSISEKSTGILRSGNRSSWVRGSPKEIKGFVTRKMDSERAHKKNHPAVIAPKGGFLWGI